MKPNWTIEMLALCRPDNYISLEYNIVLICFNYLNYNYTRNVYKIGLYAIIITYTVDKWNWTRINFTNLHVVLVVHNTIFSNLLDLLLISLLKSRHSINIVYDGLLILNKHAIRTNKTMVLPMKNSQIYWPRVMLGTQMKNKMKKWHSALITVIPNFKFWKPE